MKIPSTGMSREAIASRMEEYRSRDAAASEAKLFSLVYATRPDIMEVAKEAYTRFFAENALNPMAFPSLRRFETEIVGMALGLLNGPEGSVGTLTAGGSESLMLAVKAARDWARANKPEITEPEMLLPITAHPALLKAAHYVGLKAVTVPMTASFTADVVAAKKLVSDRTILIVGSAPQYPHGVVDPIAELGALAEERGILCHVDACVGGFMLPWVERLGHPVPPFDFRVPGVTSISADLHKYGYAAKGASLVLYRSRAVRRHQIFVTGEWPGGLFGSPGVLGTRPGGAIAAAWAVMQYLGEEGYLDLAKRALNATRAIADGVRQIPGVRILGEPVMSILAIGEAKEDAPNLFVIGDEMEKRGWRMDRQQNPTSLHLTISPAHDAIAPKFLDDLAECVKAQRENPREPEGAAAMYGMLGQLPDRGMVKDALLDFMDGLDA
jgi:sphinganine-1-phosphate aldolase